MLPMCELKKLLIALPEVAELTAMQFFRWNHSLNNIANHVSLS